MSCRHPRVAVVECDTEYPLGLVVPDPSFAYCQVCDADVPVPEAGPNGTSPEQRNDNGRPVEAPATGVKP